MILAVPARAEGVNPDVAVRVVNALRLQSGLAPLRYSDQLEKAADRHARDMVLQGFFSHRGSDGSRLGDRLRRLGYGWCAAAENIAKGQPSLPMVMQAWQQSPGHRRNILHRGVSEFALVRAEDNIWVMVLARPGCN
jgi:uncharacterized protein YkwD